MIRFLLLITILICSCSKPPEETPFEKERDRRIASIIKKYTKSMKTKGYYAAGIGEGIDHKTGKQNFLKIVFDVESLPNIDFARRVEIVALQEFLKTINSEEGIQEYIAEYPYTIKLMRIAFISQHPEEGLFSVGNCEEKIRYTLDNDGPLIELHRETYEEAVRIVQEQEAQVK